MCLNQSIFTHSYLLENTVGKYIKGFRIYIIIMITYRVLTMVRVIQIIIE